MPIVIAVDPGYRQSAFVVWDGQRILSHGIEANGQLLADLVDSQHSELLVIEEMQLFRSFSAGREVFESVFWSGRFVQAWAPRPFDKILRSQVRSHFGAMKGGDASVRAALIDRFGPFRETAIGTRVKPGPLYGIKADEWSALAIAVAYTDRQLAEGRLL